jgi:hypothetical protein
MEKIAMMTMASGDSDIYEDEEDDDLDGDGDGGDGNSDQDSGEKVGYDFQHVCANEALI